MAEARGKKATTKGVKAAAATIAAWQDDPMGLPADERPVPTLATPPLAFKIKGAAIKAGVYAQGTPGFRYWAAAEALRRGGDFWAPLLGVSRWEPGAVLSVTLDEGDDLNAFYDRKHLAFFHHEVAPGKTVYSGESPDVVCHEMGHACLDAHRPELWNAPFIEAGSFHESFGDMSAMLSALQLQSVRVAALAGVKSNAQSVLSRLAEQLGWAIRQEAPTAVDSNCLRNAHNKFTYVDPNTLPDSAPASKLCAEVHSFSRVFTGSFYEILSGMLKIQASAPKETHLAAAALDLARLLMDATTAAPVKPNYFAQVASHMIDADTSRFAGKYRKALTAVFVKRKILSAAAVAPLLAFRGKTAGTARMAAASAPMTGKAAAMKPHTVRLPASDFGLDGESLLVQAPMERVPFLTISASVAADSAHSTGDVEKAAHRFVTMLFAHKRVATPAEPAVTAAAAPDAGSREQRRKTHAVTKSAGGLKLTRLKFDCGCGLHRRAW